MNCLLYIISPTHVLSSFSALKSLHGNESITATVLVHWPGNSTEIVEEIGDTVHRITRGFSFVQKIVSITSAEIQPSHGGRSRVETVEDIRDRLGHHEFQEIYYAHDLEGGMFQLLCSAYPDARKICFGDALGNVYEKSVHLSFLTQAVGSSIQDRVKRFLRSIHPGRIRQQGQERQLFEFKPHEASLILPVDQSGKFLNGIPLTVCPKSLVMNIINQCMASSADLLSYMKDVNNTYHIQPRYLLLTDNIAEGLFMDFNKEVDMYCSIIKNNCIPDSVIFLKSHPGETLPRNEKIKELLGDLYQVVELKKRFKRYPIELWKELVQTCTVICMSYPALSLKYLYDVDVIQPMDDRFIEKWFPEWTWASYKNASSLYMKPLEMLPTWNGADALWTGNIKR